MHYLTSSQKQNSSHLNRCQNMCGELIKSEYANSWNMQMKFYPSEKAGPAVTSFMAYLLIRYTTE